MRGCRHCGHRQKSLPSALRSCLIESSYVFAPISGTFLNPLRSRKASGFFVAQTGGNAHRYCFSAAAMKRENWVCHLNQRIGLRAAMNAAISAARHAIALALIFRGGGNLPCSIILRRQVRLMLSCWQTAFVRSSTGAWVCGDFFIKHLKKHRHGSSRVQNRSTGLECQRVFSPLVFSKPHQSHVYQTWLFCFSWRV